MKQTESPVINLQYIIYKQINDFIGGKTAHINITCYTTKLYSAFLYVHTSSLSTYGKLLYVYFTLELQL